MIDTFFELPGRLSVRILNAFPGLEEFTFAFLGISPFGVTSVLSALLISLPSGTNSTWTLSASAAARAAIIRFVSG